MDYGAVNDGSAVHHYLFTSVLHEVLLISLALGQHKGQ